jgi:hypothetical protein
MESEVMTPSRLYVLHLNPESRGLTDRYAVMRIEGDGSLSPLWGEPQDGSWLCSENPKRAAKA